MRAALLTYYFPPAGGAAALRALGWARSLPREGIDLTVIAPSNGLYPMVDPSLEAAIPADLPLERVRGFLPSGSPALRQVRGGSFSEGGASHGSLLRRGLRLVRDNLFVPDEFVGFAPAAERRARQLHRQRPFDVVLTLSHPLSVHLAGRALKRRTGVPWVALLDDPWSENWFQSRSRVRRMLEPGMERSVLEECDRAVATSEDLCRSWRRRFPGLPAGHFVSMPIGYAEPRFDPVIPETSARWTLAYVGALYRDRSAGPFLDGLAEWLAREPGQRAGIRVVFAGAKDEENKEEFRAAVERHGLADVVEDRGFRPHAEGLNLICGADALLFLGGLPPEGDLTIQSKCFEYLRAGKPVLAIARPVEAVRILESGAGVVRVDRGDIQGTARALTRLRAMKPVDGRAAAAPYEVGALAGRLAEELRGVVAAHGAAARSPH